MKNLCKILMCIILISCQETENKKICFIKKIKGENSLSLENFKSIDTISMNFASYSNNWGLFFNFLTNNKQYLKEKLNPKSIKQLSKNVVERKFYYQKGDYYVYSYKNYGPIYVVRSDFGPIEYRLISHPNCKKTKIEKMINQCDSLYSTSGGLPKIDVPKE